MITPEYLNDLDWMAKAELDYWHSRSESLENRRKLSEAILKLTAEIRRRDAAEVPCTA